MDWAKEKKHTEVIKLLENAPAKVAEADVAAAKDKAATEKAARSDLSGGKAAQRGPFS